MATAKKIDTVSKLTDKVQRARAMVMADYTGLKHKQLEELRGNLKKVHGEFTITKNTLFKRVLTENKKVISDKNLDNATGTLFAYEDEAAPIAELVAFFKSANMGKIKGGMLKDTEIDAATVERLATLPTRNALLSQLVGQLMAPVSGLHNALSWNLRKFVWTLDGIKSKKTN